MEKIHTKENPTNMLKKALTIEKLKCVQLKLIFKLEDRNAAPRK